MAALNRDETAKLSLAESAMQDSASRLQRASNGAIEINTIGGPGEPIVQMKKSEVEFMINNLKRATSLVNTVKQMKGYYPS